MAYALRTLGLQNGEAPNQVGHTANDLENFDFGGYGLGHGGVANVDRSNGYWPPADDPPKF